MSKWLFQKRNNLVDLLSTIWAVQLFMAQRYVYAVIMVFAGMLVSIIGESAYSEQEKRRK